MPNEKILIVEDERDLNRLLSYNLDKEGYRTLTALDGQSGFNLFKTERPDLVLLDVMLPKMDGFEFLKEARKLSRAPILMLTAKKEEVDKILGLELGADDYVTKPFSIREVIARVRSILRRASASADDKSPVRLGDLEIDLERYEARLKDAPVPLSSKEFEFLKCLVLAKGKALTRDHLLEKVWGYDRSMEIDTRTVDQHISRLRTKLGSESGRVITVKNIGYRLKTD